MRPIIRPRPVKPPKEHSAAGLAPAMLTERADGFLRAWFTKQDVAQAVSEYFDMTRLREQFGDRLPPQGAAVWARKLLTMYLAENHAAVNAAGHGDPDKPGYAELPEKAQFEGRFKVQRGMDVAPLTLEDFATIKTNIGGTFALTIHPGGLPHDALCVTWQQAAGTGFRIVRMFPIVD